jgi:phosphate-selective porin OprO/OprP
MRAVALGLVVLGAAVGARAQAPVEPKPAPSPGVAASPEPPEEKSPPASASGDGFTLSSESGDFRLQLRGYIQFDARFYPGDDAGAATDSFLVRRARPILAGTLGRYFDFNLTPDFGGGAAVIQDAYIELRASPKVRVRVGKQKPPVGLERLQSDTALMFAERAYPSTLLPNRDVGVQVGGDLLGGVVSYAGGVFDGAPDDGSVDGDLQDGKDLAGRLFLSPWRRGSGPLKDLGFGVAGTTGDQTGTPVSYRSGGQLPIVSPVTGVVYDGARTRFTPQLSFYTGPFGLLAEYARSRSDVRKADGTRGRLALTAWQAAATFVLTGDRASFTGLRPLKPFDPAKGQWGAVELAARVDGLEVDEDTIAAGIVDPARSVRDAFAWAVGVNWHLTRNVKQVLDYERTRFKGGAPGGADRDDENALFIRTQISF